MLESGNAGVRIPLDGALGEKSGVEKSISPYSSVLRWRRQLDFESGRRRFDSYPESLVQICQKQCKNSFMLGENKMKKF